MVACLERRLSTRTQYHFISQNVCTVHFWDNKWSMRYLRPCRMTMVQTFYAAGYLHQEVILLVHLYVCVFVCVRECTSIINRLYKNFFIRGVGSNFWLGGGWGTRLHRRDSTPTILVNFAVVLHEGNIQIQIVQLKYVKVSLPKEIFVMTSS